MTTLQQLESIIDKIESNDISWQAKFVLLKNFIRNKKEDERKQIINAYETGHKDYANFQYVATSGEDYYSQITEQ
jgi:hypothetical protein